MFGQTITLFLGLAVVLLTVSLVVPNWHSTSFDPANRFRTFSGLWRQVLQLSDTSPDPVAYCDSLLESDCKTGNPMCNWIKEEGKCMSNEAICGARNAHDKTTCETPKKGAPGATCKWDGMSCRHKGQHGYELDVSIPWHSKDDATMVAMTWTRVLGIVAAAVAFVTLFIAGASPTPRPLLVAMLGGASAASAIATLAVYSTQLTDSFGLANEVNEVLEADAHVKNIPTIHTPTLRGLINMLFRGTVNTHAEQLYGMPSVTKQGASYYMVVAAVLLLLVVSILGVVDRRAAY